jgi:uncharacterized protein YutE (UPF0331/DUF86 family)
MTPGTLSERVVLDRTSWVHSMLEEIRALPLEQQKAFFSDRRNVWTAESCLRRALEALLDLGRHILAKGFGQGVTEYKDIAQQLKRVGVLTPDESELLRTMAGYRNRMVHFYHEITDEELYAISTQQLGDVETVLQAMVAWIEAHPELLDRSL